VLEPARQAAAHVLVDDVTAPVLRDEDSHHLRTVLRLRAGEMVSITDGRGGWRPCAWDPPGSVKASGEVNRTERAIPEVCVAFAAVKGDRNEWAVQKLTELGVDRIILLRSERSVVKWDEGRARSQLERLRRVARSALMQSRGLWLPSVEGIVNLTSAACLEGVAIADPGGGPFYSGVRAVIVGPEGGWSPAEVAGSNAPRIRLGDTVLRTESAALVAGALLTSIRAGLVTPAGTDGG
jgi:16S rRNA (uracil1498-N3)-methyltransferase